MLSSTYAKSVHTVTFDCWSTLIYEEPGQHGARARRFADLVGSDEASAAEALSAAWKQHQQAWHRQEVFAGPDIVRHAIGILGIDLPPHAFVQVLDRMEEDVLDRRVHAIAGANEFLSALRAAGIRTALICDTGFTPGRIVRSLLARVGLLDRLEVTIFSDEIGVPKPNAFAFESALSALGTEPIGAVHVGDIRRSDVAGALAMGMTSVRFRGHHDDNGKSSASISPGILDCATAGCNPPCPRPEADIIVDSYSELADIFGLPLGLE